MFLANLWNREEFSLCELRVHLLRIINRLHQMGAMATVAGNANRNMLRVSKAHLFPVRDVAGKTAFCILCRISMKAENQLGGRRDLRVVAVGCFFGVGVYLARTVAGFTIHDRVIGLIAETRVRRLPEFDEFGFMAGAAALAAHVAIGRWLGMLLPGGRGRLNGGRASLSKARLAQAKGRRYSQEQRGKNALGSARRGS